MHLDIISHEHHGTALSVSSESMTNHVGNTSDIKWYKHAEPGLHPHS